MVHNFYFYDNRVGTGRLLSISYPVDDEHIFADALDDIRYCLNYPLVKYSFMILNPEDVSDSLTNIVVDCSESVLSELIEFVEVFFKIRGFMG